MAKTVDYNQINQELETVMVKLQAEDIDVDEAVKLYERGVTLIAELEQHLKTAENKVKKVRAAAGDK